MFTKSRFRIALISSVIAAFTLASTSAALAQEDKKPDKPAKEKTQEDKAKDKNYAPLPLKLPKPAFKGTPKNVPAGTNLEKPRKGPRPEFYAPKGAKNIAEGLRVRSSDEEPIIGELEYITDGDKEAAEGSYVELGPGLQWVQLDLKKKCAIHAVLIWHYHMSAQVYHDVVVQVADDADFVTNVRTVFNNDHDNSAGLGVGKNKEFWETFEGKLIDAKGVEARYIRFYSKGNTSDDQNHYTEVEVWATPEK